MAAWDRQPMPIKKYRRHCYQVFLGTDVSASTSANGREVITIRTSSQKNWESPKRSKFTLVSRAMPLSYSQAWGKPAIQDIAGNNLNFPSSSY
jgi:hypothetical protein